MMSIMPSMKSAGHWLTKPWTMLRPSPLPFPIAFVVKNGSNTLARTSSLIPVPVSLTATITYSPDKCSGRRGSPAPTFSLEIVRMPPVGIASRALIARFRTASSSWPGSAIVAPPRPMYSIGG